MVGGAIGLVAALGIAGVGTTGGVSIGGGVNGAGAAAKGAAGSGFTFGRDMPLGTERDDDFVVAARATGIHAVRGFWNTSPIITASETTVTVTDATPRHAAHNGFPAGSSSSSD